MFFDLPDPEVLATPLQPEAAIAFWQWKAALPYNVVKKMEAGARERAFYVTGLAERDAVQAVKDALQEALDNGETLQDFKKRCKDVIDSHGWHDNRVETIFRNNMQTAYSAGRYAKMQAVKKARPFWQYFTVGDERVRPSHGILDGAVYPADHPFWSEHYPPNGHKCRCGVRTLSARQVEEDGLEVQSKMPESGMYTDPKTGMEYHVARPGADNGWNSNPGKSWVDGLDLSKHPDLGPKAYAEQRPQVINEEEKLRPEAVKTYEELCTGIKNRCGQFVKNSEGIMSVEVVGRQNYFMATNCKGKFALNKRSFATEKGAFSAAGELKSAWNKLAKGKDLTWNEEYSMEALWHEMVHNRQVITATKKGVETSVMEAVTQWTARRTYPELLQALGGRALHQESIKFGGLGYGSSVKNLDRLFKALKFEEKDLLPVMKIMIEKVRMDKYVPALSDVLEKFSGIDSKKIKAALSKIASVSNDAFELVLFDLALVE